MPAKTLVARANPAMHAPATALAAAAPTLSTVAPPARTASAARPVYPLSVVAGGVVDRAELKQVVKRDAVVAAHYATFDVNTARVVRNPKPRAVHVSYRKGDQIFWTAKKVMLASNETLLSDGVNEMRTRCANRISDVAMLPVASDEPTEELLNAELAPDAPSLMLAGDDAGNGKAVLAGNLGGGGIAGGGGGGGADAAGSATGSASGEGQGGMSQARSQGRSGAAGKAGSAGGTSPSGWTNVGLDLGDAANAGNVNNGAANVGGETTNTGSIPQVGAPGAGGKPDKAGNPVAGNTPGDGSAPGKGTLPANASTPTNSSTPANGSTPNNSSKPANGITPSNDADQIAIVPASESSGSGDVIGEPAKPVFVEPADTGLPDSVGPIKPEAIVAERPPIFQPDTLPIKPTKPTAAGGDSSDVPEPATLVMVVSALALLGALRRRQRGGAAAAATATESPPG